MNRKAINQKDHIKYLGVLIDEHLNWKYHILNVSKKVSRSIGIISKLRFCMNKKQLRNYLFFTCLFTLHLNDSTCLRTGDYCGEPGLNQTSGPCDAGYYCPPGQNVSNQAGM